jgi:hypothetical protein
MLSVKIGRWFEIDTGHGFHIRLPFIGAGHRHAVFGWTWDRWSTLKATGEV